MPSIAEVFLEALAFAAIRRRALSVSQAQRLTEFLQENRVFDPAGVRDWLQGNASIGADLSRNLLEILPRRDTPSFGRYTALAFLAEGGMGTVWLGSDERGQLVVLKSMRKNLNQGQEFIHRFKRETQIMMDLRHPNLVRCLDNGQADDGSLFMVLEFVRCGTLKDLLLQGPLSARSALSITRKVLDALDLAHQKELVHRDVKPGNIFANKGGLTKLGDFGLARSTASERTALTMQGAIIGTPQYMSPEQVMGSGEVDIRADIYATGCVLFFALVGQDPYTGKLHDILHAHTAAPIPLPSSFRDDIPAGIDALIESAMAKDINQRFPTPAVMRDSVDAMLKEQGGPEDNPTDESIFDAVFEVSEDAQKTETILTDLLSTRVRKGVNLEATATMQTGDKGSSTFLGQGSTPAKSIADEDGDADFRLEGGSISEAVTADWLSLRGPDSAHLVMLFAREQLSLGKLREAPVDLCLRNYPIAVHKQACLKVSRQHLNLTFNDIARAVMVEDLGSSNGTHLAGNALAPKQPVPIGPGLDYRMTVAGVVGLQLRIHAASSDPVLSLAGCPLQGGRHPVGIDRDLPLDNMVIKRPDNRPEMAYAMVLRRVSLGGLSAELPLVGATANADVELALFAGHWIWRPIGQQAAWRPVKAGTLIEAGGIPLRIDVGAYEHFHE